MQKPAHEIYSFDDYRLDLTRGALFHLDDEVRLRPKSFEVLQYLVENQGRLVGKDELITAIRQGTAVTDDSLVQCLKDIRRVLHDDSQEIIKTVPRRGYVFEKEIRANGSEVLVRSQTDSLSVRIEEFTEIASPSPTGFRLWLRRHKLVTALAIGAMLIGVGVVSIRPILAWYFKPPSIAILPIVNATGNHELDYISDGVHETLIISLARLNTGSIPRLRVFAQNVMIMFKDKGGEPREIGKQLGADSVLVSKMLQEGNLRTFKFEMIDVADGSVVWAKQYGIPLDNPFDFLMKQNQIASDIVGQIPLKLSNEDRASVAHVFTQNPEAYDLFLKGRENRTNTASALRHAIEYYERAIDLDPNFALAYWAMGAAYAIQGKIDERPSIDANERSVKAFEKALEIDNNLTTARNTMLGFSGDRWDWTEIQTAGQDHLSYWQYLEAAGETDEAVKVIKKRLSNAQYNPYANSLYCIALLDARRPDDAIEQARHTLELVPAPDRAYFGPESPWIHLLLALAYRQKKMYAESISEQKLAIELSENSKSMRAELAAIYAEAGKKDEARAILLELSELERQGEFVPALNIAFTYCSLGEKDMAFAWLDRAYVEREDRLPNFANRPDCDLLHDDPRFTELLKRIGVRN